MKRKGNMFVFTPELGERLRVLRRRKGLTLLDKYTSQPIKEAKVEVKEGIVLQKPKFVRTPEEKAKRNRQAYILKLLHKDVEERLYQILKELGDQITKTSVCVFLCRYGRRWFDILWRTKERPKSRERQLNKEKAKGIPEGINEEWVKRVEGEMATLFKEKAANPPEVPENAHPGMLTTVLRAEDRFLTERSRTRSKKERLRVYRLAMFATDILTYLQGQGLRNGHIQNFNSVLFPELMRICEETEGKEVERQKRIEELIQPWLKFPQTRKVVEMFLQCYEKWKNWLPKGL